MSSIIVIDVKALTTGMYTDTAIDELKPDNTELAE